MTYYIRPYRHNPKKFEYDIKLRMPDGTNYRERKVSPVTTKSGTERWVAARERDIILAGTAPQAKQQAGGNR